MMTNNFVLYGTKIFVEFWRDILLFPFWWYSRGLVLVAGILWQFLANREKANALFIWIKNLFRPMYGQTDWQGVMISFFMRIVMIAFKFVVMVFWSLFAMVMLTLWIIAPIFVVYEIIYQING